MISEADLEVGNIISNLKNKTFAKDSEMYLILSVYEEQDYDCYQLVVFDMTEKEKRKIEIDPTHFKDFYCIEGK